MTIPGENWVTLDTQRYRVDGLILSQADSSLTVSICRSTGGVSRHPQSP